MLMLPALALLVFISSPLLAQSAPSRSLAWLDVGGAQVRQPTSTTRTAASLGAGLWYSRHRVAVAGEGNVTIARDSISAAQYIVRASLLPVAWSRTDIDVSATTNGIVLPGSNGNRSVMLRQFWRVRAMELSGSVGAGRTSRLRNASSGHAFGAGAEWQLQNGQWRVGTSLQRSYSDDYQLMEASGIALGRIAPRYTLDDVNAQLSWQRGPLWINAQRGWRRGVGASVGNADGFNVSAAIAMSTTTTLIVQTGEQFADVVRGVPQARYTGVAMRWNPARARVLRTAVRTSGDTRTAPGVSVVLVPDVRGDEVLLQRTEGVGTITISIAAPPQAVVELATSQNDWQPVRLAQRGELFVQQLTLPAGAHRIAVRVNGGPWRAPRGLAPVNDDFGGKAGVVVIP
ncbi:hypothetical protein [Gemmatimonas sp.]|uniref:hypothetical protein n=1 Tax=Gemmatimonas sp. TaxID=1962908 RepID=UPI003F707681